MLRYLYLLSSLLLFSVLTTAPASAQSTRHCQEDSRISVAFTGDTIISTCTADDVRDRIRFQVEDFRQAFAYVVVDENDMIVRISFSNFINFDMLPAGTLRVYAFSTFGRITAGTGQAFSTASLSSPCFGTTQNFVTVFNGSGGQTTISGPGGATDFVFCPGDNQPDLIELTGTTSAPNLAFIATDTLGNVLAVDTTGSIDFDGAGAGTCFVYGFGYSGELNIPLGSNVSALGTAGGEGCTGGLSENFLTVTRENVDGGAISTMEGEDRLLICPADGQADSVTFITTGATGSANRYVITDAFNVIIGLPEGDVVDFEGVNEGTCRVWNISYEGDFVARTGRTIANTPISTGCFSLSENFVEVVRRTPEAGRIVLDGTASTDTTVCPMDGNGDFINVSLVGAGQDSLAFVAVGDDLRVLAINTDGRFNVENAPAGTCRIYGLAYQGFLNMAAVGDIFSQAIFTEDCFAFSENFITVNRQQPEGGTVATNDGETEITICPGDGVSDLIPFASTGASGGIFTYVVTDQDNNVLAVPEGRQVDFETAGLGICRVWGLSYQGDLLAVAGDDATATELSSGCFALSDNFVTVTREGREGGRVSLENGATIISICPGDGLADLLTLTTVNADSGQYAYIITDTSLNILSTSTSPSIDFEGASLGTCRIYGLSYSGTLTAEAGQNLATDILATECAGLSENWVTVTRTSGSTGEISLESGAADTLVCPGDLIPDPVFFDSTGTTLTNFNYLVTDTNGVILQIAFSDRINFEGFPTGVCRVWGLGYNGVIEARPGDTVGTLQLASQCSALSPNFVTVTKQLPMAGTITTINSEDSVSVCSMDEQPDLVQFATPGAAGNNYVFVLTTDAGVVLSTSENNGFDFDAAPFGTCRVYGLSYQGELLLMAEDTLLSAELATGCSDLTENWVTVIREGVMGGTISLTDGATEAATCPGDGQADELTFTVSGSSDTRLLYVVTDDNNVILNTSISNAIDFEGAGTGTCRVWSLSFAGEAVLMVGDTIDVNTDLATGCAALSENFVTVIREQPVGGRVALGDGATDLEICAASGDGQLLGLGTTSTSSNYAYVLVSEADTMTLAVAGDVNGLEVGSLPSGDYRIFGLAFTGTLGADAGAMLSAEDLVATGCAELSDNFVSVSVTNVSVGDVLVDGNESVFLCPTNQNDGLLALSTTASEGDTNLVYAITTAQDNPIILSAITADTFDFGQLPLQQVRVYAVRFTGTPSVGSGQPLLTSTLSDGCAAISNNFVTVNNFAPEAGTLTIDGLPITEVSCFVDGSNDLSASVEGASSAGYALVVTDTSGTILGISPSLDSLPVSGLPVGEYLLYGLSYTGNLLDATGQAIADAVPADNCFELTETPVPFGIGGSIEAGTITNASNPGSDTIMFCAGQGNELVVVDASVSGPNYRFIITDDTGDIILPNIGSDIITFSPVPAGTYRVYGFNFTGTASAFFGRNVETDFLSDSCFALTSNFLTVIKTEVNAGMVSTPDGETDITLEIEPDVQAPIAEASFINSADSLSSFTYVITDTANVILGLSTSDTINFGPAGLGVCRVWGLAYTGTLTAEVGDTAASAALSDDCFALSDNFVTVNRVPQAAVATPELVRRAPEVSAPTLNAFPNPATDGELTFTIEDRLLVSAGTVTLRDMNGTVLFRQDVDGNRASVSLKFDIGRLNAGIYFIHYGSAAGSYTHRFVKQ